MTKDERIARNRFLALNLIRISGVAMVFLGLAITEGVIGWPVAAGYVLVVAGFVETFFVPRIVARGWRTPEQ